MKKQAITISLLAPSGYEQRDDLYTSLSQTAVEDLDLESTVSFLAGEHIKKNYIRDILFSMSSDVSLITYRQDVFEDLFRNPSLSQGLEELLPVLARLQQYQASMPDEQLLYEVTRRLGELEIYLDSLEGIKKLLDRHTGTYRSEGLSRLHELVIALLNEETIANLKKELPELLKKVRNIKSVSIGVNLDHRLRPVEATLLSIDSETYDGYSSSLINKLFNVKNTRDAKQGIAPLHQVPATLEGAPAQRSDSSTGRVHPMMVPLFRDLADVLNKVSRPLAQALKQYTSINTSFLITIRRELAFYIGSVKLFRYLQEAGLPVCRPAIAAPQERICTLREMYNPNLAVRLQQDRSAAAATETIVKNDLEFDSDKRVFILTGPNRGGKTTYMQAMGMIQVLAQTGTFIPAEEATISSVDTIHSHFPTEERPELNTGRFGEEAKRLNEIFSKATPHSLILLNESLSNTSHSESLYLSMDVVRILLKLGARTIFATHLHELACELEALNRECDGHSKAVSMVARIEEKESSRTGKSFRRTFKIVPGPPAGRSYATEIAAHHGITYDQLHKLLTDRGVIE
jgi:DNA mismatch repair ATPase MutS